MPYKRFLTENSMWIPNQLPEHNQLAIPLSKLLNWIASARCCVNIDSDSSMSAMVLATFKIRA